MMGGDAQKKKGDHRRDDLEPDGVLGAAEEGFDPEMLFDPAEEEFDLPTLFIEASDLIGRSIEIIADDGELAAALGYRP